MLQNSQTKNVTKLTNTKCDKSQNFKMWENLKAKMEVTIKSQIMAKFKYKKDERNQNFDSDITENSSSDKTLQHIWDVLWAAFCDLQYFFSAVVFKGRDRWLDKF